MYLQYFTIFVTLISLQARGLSQQQSPSTDAALISAWQDNPQVRQCGLCHFSPGNDFSSRDTDFCRLIEAKIWLTNDKHAIARRRIEPQLADAASARHRGATEVEAWITPSNRLSYAMVSRLGYAIDTEAGYAQFRENCLTCHAGFQNQDDPQEFAKTATNRPGISCNVCHQMGDDTRWIDEHSGLNTKQEWRIREPGLKAEKGMRNLVSVDDQADLCLKCHVGDIQQNMFITHQMYAAGHPPLPSFELGALLDAMPRHWRTNTELYQSLKNYRERELYFKQTLGPTIEEAGEPMDQLDWRVQTIVIGAITAYQQSLALIEQAASPNSKRWGDYALYDCSGCHHELKVPSSRQAARSGSPPGRPRLVEWPKTLSAAAFESIQVAPEIVNAENQLHRAVAETPFGNRQQVALRAKELDALLLHYRTQLERESLKPAFISRYLVALTQTEEKNLIDYQTARQMNWAIRGIDSELNFRGSPLQDLVRKRIAQLGISSGVIQVESEIPGSQTREIFPAFVDAELKRQSQYDSRQFHIQLQSVRDALR